MDPVFAHFSLIFTIVFCFIGAGFIFIGAFAYRKAKKTLSWKQTQGTILLSEVKKSASNAISPDIGSNTNRANYRYANIYTPEVSYSYRVQMVDYVSNKIDVFKNFGTSSSARAFAITKKYPVNANVTVYYDPENPKDAVLEAGVKTGSLFFLIVGIALFVIPLVIYFLV